MLDRDLDAMVRLRTPGWCRDRLGGVRSGVIDSRDHRSPHHGVGVACLADGLDVVLVVLERGGLTRALVWDEITVMVCAPATDEQRWVVRASGICEREPLPAWGAREAPYGLRLREAGLRGYSVRRSAAAR